MNNYNQYPKGSEWLKWDLHIHSPLTHLNNQFNDDWENWIKKLIENNIRVIGLTNYFRFAENEIEIVREKLNMYNILVLPNLEFRIAQPNKSGDYINLHIIFNQIVTTESINQFLNRLKTRDDRYCFSLSARNDFETVVINEETLINQLKEDFKEKNQYFVVCCPNGYGGFRSDNNVGRSVSVAQIFDKMADFFFGRSQDKSHFLNTERYENALQKPVIFASDAHKIDVIGLQNFTWIKANPTFEGLRQIIFEPEYRVKIQEEKPEQKRKSDFIDKVRFVDASDGLVFKNDWIELNPNLNAIIGGKSTGKTLLLHYIVQTIGYTEKKYDFKNDFEVMWADGETYKLSDNSKKQRPVTYIAQQDLINIAENNKQFSELVLTFLQEKNNFQNEFEKLENNVKGIKVSISDNITQYLLLLENLQSEKDKKLGDKIAKQNEIKENQEKIKKIEEKANISQEQKNELEKLKEQKNELEKNIRNKENIFSILREYKTITLSKIKALKNDLLREKETIELKFNSQNLGKEILDSIKIDTLIEEFNLKIDNNFIVSENIEQKIIGLNTQLGQINIQIENITNLLGSEDAIKKLQNEISDFQNEIVIIEKNEKLVQEYTDKLNNLSNSIFKRYEDLINEYQNFINTINATSDYSALIPESNINLTASLEYNNENFNGNFITCFNGKQISSTFSNIFPNSEYTFAGKTTHLETIKKIFNIITTKENLPYNKNKDIKISIEALFNNNFSYKFNLNQDGDDILKMSPGKKGLVLLKLHLSLQQAKYPILIDQPEDNLDNRTVFQELKDFIKTKKIQRQIIIVTHNANLVVATDAEQIIVANQKGQNGTEQQEYQFEYITGALEYSFEKKSNKGILYDKGIKEHVCEILEGGKEAFKKRDEKYGFTSNNK